MLPHLADQVEGLQSVAAVAVEHPSKPLSTSRLLIQQIQQRFMRNLFV
jgi:hypothetical protein